MSEPMTIQEKCAQYQNAQGVGDAELHALLRTIHRMADEQAEHVDYLEQTLGDLNDEHGRVLNEACPSDEVHCACVPVLHARIAELEAALDAAEYYGTAGLAVELVNKDKRIAELEALLRDVYDEFVTLHHSLRDRRWFSYESRPLSDGELAGLASDQRKRIAACLGEDKP